MGSRLPSGAFARLGGRRSGAQIVEGEARDVAAPAPDGRPQPLSPRIFRSMRILRHLALSERRCLSPSLFHDVSGPLPLSPLPLERHH
jgi:hypothetical protein